MRYNCLSNDLQDYVDVLDKERRQGLSPEELKELEQNERFVDFVVEHMIASRETFLEKPVAALERLREADPDLIASLIDDCYTRKSLDKIAELVVRTLQLSQLETARVPSGQTRTYLLEATRTYIYGLPQASIALSRAALEQGLKEVLGKQGKGDYTMLTALIQEARRWDLLDDATVDWAHNVRKQGDDVIHERPANDVNAFDVLTKVRGILTYIYQAETTAGA